MADENEDKFDSQTFLLAYLNQIMPDIKDNVKFKHIYLLDTTEETPTSKVISLLTNKTKGAKSFTKLKTHQYNALIPKITLYRVDQDIKGKKTEREFVFPKNTRNSYVVSDLTSGAFIRGNNCGIKNIKWEIAGTDPVSAEKTISATIDFYFDSINSFSGGSFLDLKQAYLKATELDSKEFSKFDGPKTTTNYWSLIFHPSFKNTNNGISNQEDAPKDYDTTKFRIKCVVGWNDLDSNIKKELFSNVSDIDSVISNLTTSMYLNLIKHEFKFNEDGSLLLTATYVASLENSLRSDKFDLLGGLKEKLNNLKFQFGDGLTANISPNDIDKLIDDTLGTQDVDGSAYDRDLAQIYRKLITTGTSADDLRRTIDLINNPNCAPPELSVLLEGVSDPAKIQEQLIKQLDIVTELISKQEQILKKEFYNKLLDKLFNSANNKSIFYLTLDETDIREFLRWRKNPVNLSTQKKIDTNIVLDTNNTVLKIKLEEVKKALDNNKPKIDQDVSDAPTSPNETISKTISFTTVGSLVDVALDVLQNTIKEQSVNADFQRFKILLGNFSTSAPLFQATKTFSAEQPVSNNLAYLPIDIERFLLFFSTEVIESSVTSYPFFNFFKNLINKLIYSSLNAEGIDNKEINQYADVSLAGIVLNLGNTGQTYLDKVFDSSTRLITSNKVTEESLTPYYIKNNYNSNHIDYTSIYFLFDKYQKDYFGNGIIAEDESKGIYHYTVAQDYGLIKSINFKRIDQPFLKEAKAVGQKTFFLGQFRDIYNVEIKMIGNNLYYPGMMLFVKPSIEFGNPAIKNSFSQITGIGGYFQVIKVSNIITEDMYETVLDCVYQSSGGEDKTKKSQQELCQEDKDKYKPGTSLVMVTANSIFSLSQEIKALEDEYSSLSYQDKVNRIEVINQKKDSFAKLLTGLKDNAKTDPGGVGNAQQFAISTIENQLGKDNIEKIKTLKQIEAEQPDAYAGGAPLQ
jgi:hypothetical protein